MNSERTKSPQVVLFGTFPDLFMEALKELEVEFVLAGKAGKDIEADIIVIEQDMLEKSVELVRKYKAVPIVKCGTPGFFDFNPLKEAGNAFLYREGSTWFLLQALVRAMETYKFTYDWGVLQGEVTDFAKYFVKDSQLIKRS